ncbi:hypothetical protein LCGC14_0620090 [marine sediment metagenome]|uniref:Uncharacterized protein n=1 Tax=marine sediment metagenome TaxID=412755 RepID=A0A0F9RPE9_9ZZZZ
MTPCNYDKSFACFRTGCSFESITNCLKEALASTQRDLALLQMDHTKRKTAHSEKWRRSCTYYRNRCRELEAKLGINGKGVRDEGIEGQVHSAEGKGPEGQDSDSGGNDSPGYGNQQG